MSVNLIIRDGSPWYMSPDIVVRRSTNVLDPPAEPALNRDNYVFVTVTNNGAEATTGCPCSTVGNFRSVGLVAPGSGVDLTGLAFVTQEVGASPSGATNVVVDATGNGAVVLRDTATSAELYRRPFGAGEVVGWGYSRDGDRLFIASNTNQNGLVVAAEGPRQGQPSLTFTTRLNGNTRWCGFSPSGKTFLVRRDDTVILYNTDFVGVASAGVAVLTVPGPPDREARRTSDSPSSALAGTCWC